MRRIEFFFDFGCPYSYLAMTRLASFAKRADVALHYRCVDGELVKLAAGNFGPANRDVPAKQRYVEQDVRRWARRYGIALGFTSAPAPRANLGMHYAASIGEEARYVEAMFRHLWGGAGGDPKSVFAGAAAELGWEAAVLDADADSPRAARFLKETCEHARARGVFGVPTFIAGDRLYWGNDRLDLLEARFAGATAEVAV